MDRIKCISCNAETYNVYGATPLHCHSCYSDIEDELATLRAQLEQYRWIPVSERLPEFMYGGKVGKKLASRPVDIAYRYKSENRYFSTRSQFLREYGWVLEFVQGQPKTFEDYGYIIDFWREIGPLPSIQDAADD